VSLRAGLSDPREHFTKFFGHEYVDDVIDPMDSRRWISNALLSVPKAERQKEKKRRNVDTW